MSKQDEKTTTFSQIAIAATKGAGALLVIAAAVLSYTKKRGTK